MQLRNCILIALAFDASQQEIDQAHELIDKVYNKDGGIDAGYVVTASVAADAPRGDAPTATTGAELDGDGLPWDERIHSSSRALTDKGVWRARRNVDPALKKKVEAELRGTLQTSAPVGDAPAPPAPAAPPTPAAPPAPAGLPPMPGAAPAAVIDPNYTELVKLIATNTRSAQNPEGRITDEWVTQVIAHYGVPDGSLQNLAHSPEKVAEVLGYMKSVL